MIKSRLLLLEIVVGLFVGIGHLTAQVVPPISLAWNASPSSDVSGYIVRYGTTSGVYSSATNVGNQTSASVTGLQAGQTYYLVVTACNAAGVESLPSNEATYQAAMNLPVIMLSDPIAGASFQSPATINLAASVTANGHTITKVQFLNGTTLLGEDAASPYSYMWNNVVAGNYSLTARVVYDAGSTLDSAMINVVVAGLPAPWQTTDIGSVGLTGSASAASGVYTISGAGQLTGTSDSLRFLYQSLSADGEIKARLTSVQTNNANCRFGVMIRDNLSPNSKYAFMGVSQDLKFRWQRRSSSGGNTASTISTASTPPNTWVRLVRAGSTITGYMSDDGANWTQVNSRNISMATNVFIGFIAASGSTNSVNTAVFANGFVVP